MPSSDKKKKDNDIFRGSYRIIDANLNRAKEGLRVCEDICRFNLKDARLSAELSRMRHDLTLISKRSRLDQYMLFENRDAGDDIGRSFSLGPKRKSFKGIFLANSQRVKEALRGLEEFFKVFDNEASKKIQKLRFKFYAFEKRSVQRFPSLLGPR
ncbi:MAG TPA: hypothetical protein DCL35_00450 [Candidatus Omnitrophica bacterium]|nr:hypothetical protein [Candidatus Omnitrophota bacterium]